MGYEKEFVPNTTASITVYTLSLEEVAMLLPLVKKQRDKFQERYLKAQDIVDGGYATPLQTTIACKNCNEFQKWDFLYSKMNY